jgi:hypothetical protein
MTNLSKDLENFNMSAQGFYETVTKEILAEARDRTGMTQKIINVIGNRSSGKKTVCLQALKLAGIPLNMISLPEISADGPHAFVSALAGITCALLTEYEDMQENGKCVLADWVITNRIQAVDDKQRILLIPSLSPLEYADVKIKIPDLPTDSRTHFLVCESVLNEFPTDELCPVMQIVLQSTRKLPLGKIASLMNLAKSLALSTGGALNCSHIVDAFHSLVVPMEPVTLASSDIGDGHNCEFLHRSSFTSGLDSYIGLSEDTKSVISRFLEIRSKLLLLSGPIGCGKTHLAHAIAWNSSQPTVRLTAADILRSKIGETEKTFFKALTTNDRLVIEDIDKLVPEDASECTGSVQRCLPVLISFLDRMEDKIVIGTTRDRVHPLIERKAIHVYLSNTLSFSEKVQLIRAQFPAFDESAVTAFDLINLTNRSLCIDYGRELKMKLLRQLVNSQS